VQRYLVKGDYCRFPIAYWFAPAPQLEARNVHQREGTFFDLHQLQGGMLTRIGRNRQVFAKGHPRPVALRRLQNNEPSRTLPFQ
jgi:hypothetical protein